MLQYKNELLTFVSTSVISDQRKEEIINWINNVLVNSTHAQTYTQTQVEHIVDYLVGADTAPVRLRKASVEQMHENAEKWTKALGKNGKKLGKMEQDGIDYEIVKEIPGVVPTRWVKLKSKLAYEHEGAAMRHCVSSYYGKSNTEIYSLRDNRNEPHCTIEIVVSSGGNNIQQIKGKGNGEIAPNYINAVIDFLESKGFKIRSTEMTNLGYIFIPEQFFEVFKETVEETYGPQKFIKVGKDNYIRKPKALEASAKPQGA